MLQKTEAALNERLASAAAALQSYTMNNLPGGGQQASAPTPSAAAPFPHHRSSGRLETGQSRIRADAHRTAAAERAATAGQSNLKMVGEGMPSSNERLGLILADLMD